MAGNLSRSSDESSDNSFVISDRDSDEDEQIVSLRQDQQRQDRHLISDNEDRMTPIHTYIRRSIHKFEKTISNDIDSSEEEEIEDSREDSHEKTSKESDEESGESKNSSSPKAILIPDSSDESQSISPIMKAKNKIYQISSSSASDSEVQNESHEVNSFELNPIVAQKRAYLEYEKASKENKLAKIKMLYTSGTVHLLPDKGEKLRLSIIQAEKELEMLINQLIKLETETNDKNEIKTERPKKELFKKGSLDIDPTYLQPTTSEIYKERGKQATETFEREQLLTVDRLKDLHGSLVQKPAENQLADDPCGLKVKLMPHQKYALTWLLWREKSKPSGGVLADDMGLGKTLTMISLVLASKEDKETDNSDDEEQWLSSHRSQRYLGGTLVVAPASLASQWESEIKNRCKRSLLSVELYHGNNRENNPKRLSRNDIVISTYNIVSRSYKSTGIIHKIMWKRVILDEAHVIRNHKSQTCEGVCGLSAKKRWVLTGTPIQNKEMDLFSILKFLRCSPFDDIRVWKRWVDNKNDAGHERLATVMKTIMLRRTKAELQRIGEIDPLPEKMIETVEIVLDEEERLVYDKVMVFSRTIFAQFLAQRAEKAQIAAVNAGMYDKPSWMVNYKDTQFTKAQKKLLSMHADVASHQILVLLLRLRQLCCHPSLVKSMLNDEDIEQNDLAGIDESNKLTSKLLQMSLNDTKLEDDDDDEIGVDRRISENLLTEENPVFDPKRQSSKMRTVIEKVKEIVPSNDKIIIVSQWVSVLNIIEDELKSVPGVKSAMFTGKVAVKDRQGIMDNFNSPNSKVNVLLLSLTAGGVGLNLVGANHMLLVDIHWNPQLESQAQDRIYRFGQKKPVYLYKYICLDTIEERVKALQEKKMQIAESVLSGSGKVAAAKLTLEDMKSLFGM